MSILSQQLKTCIRSIKDIQHLLSLSVEEIKDLTAISERYPLCITPYYLNLANPSDPKDPIRRMCIPALEEFSLDGEFDTSGESDNTVIKGMQHKYAQTALILSTNQCAMYCRHCFRKRMVGSNADEIAKELPAMAEYIIQHPTINNVLISGGDAFINENDVIKRYLETFCNMPSLGFVRFGTRVPVVLPQRITQDKELISLLSHYGKKKQIIIVTQFNHPREITPSSQEAIRVLIEQGCIMRNQTVLLKGINDDPKVLGSLINNLVGVGVIPYYIFQCRPVVGVKNQFQVPLLKAVEIVDKAKNLMNGQAKSVRYAMSHPTGKIEIIGKTGDKKMLFKYHQAKDSSDASRLFALEVDEKQCWLGTIPQKKVFDSQ